MDNLKYTMKYTFVDSFAFRSNYPSYTVKKSKLYLWTSALCGVIGMVYNDVE